MKNIIATAGILFGSLLVSATVRADCTSNPFRMGWDAANQACDDIASGYVPTYPELIQQESGEGKMPTPERSCSTSDVIRCKNAMAQYLRSGEGRACGRLIRRDEPLENSPGDTAGQVWRNYVVTTCNR